MILIVLGARRVKALKEKKHGKGDGDATTADLFKANCKTFPSKPFLAFLYFPPNVAPWFGK